MNIYDFTVKSNTGEEVSLDIYKDKVLLVVNTATKCGLTPQYDALEELYKTYRSRGFEVLDFPCNQFREQAPESDAEIQEFCTLKYHTEFARFAKIDVNGDNADPLFVWLKQQRPTDDKKAAFDKLTKVMSKGLQPGDITWNFGKFLINREGEVVGRFSPGYAPEKLANEIEKYL